MSTKPTTGYSAPSKPTGAFAVPSKSATPVAAASKETTTYLVDGSEGGVTLGDMAVRLSSLVVTLGSGAISTLQNDKNTTQMSQPAKPATGYL